VTSSADPAPLSSATIDQISIVLFVMSEIAGGDTSVRVDVDGWAATPIEQLAHGVNRLADALARAAAAADRARQDLEEKLRIVESQRAAIDEQ
jgi:rsbT co-antagonist protein RsbR